MSALLPAVVLGIDTQIGLAVVRDLGMRGVPVHGIARNTAAVSLSSRFLYRGYIRAAGEAALIDQLVELGEALRDACLFAISESDITMLNRHRPRLHRYRMLFADDARMQRVVNKDQTYVAAERVGLRVPRTVALHNIEDLANACHTLRFPVVLKWANPNEAARLLSKVGLLLEKTHYCHSAEELRSYLATFESLKLFPLIQEYCPGYGLGQFILMQGGRAHYVFQHRRLHEWPPEGGVSTLCESVSLQCHRGLMEKSIALLRELDWEGVAMVEYRHDPTTGMSTLMEINGRYWGSLPLACHAGASFPWFSYQLLGLRRPISAGPYRSKLRCRFMIPETKRLLLILFRQGRIADRSLSFRRIPELAHYLFDFIRPGTCYYVFDWKDFSPFLRDIAHGIQQLLPLRRLISRDGA